MNKVILIVLCLLVSGCDSKPECHEVADGSGRTGVSRGWDVFHKLRMDDTGNVELHRYTVRVDCKNKLDKGNQDE